MSEAFNQAQSDLDKTKDQEQSGVKSKLKSAGKGLVAFTGKTLDVAGTIGMQAMAIVALWIVGAVVLDIMGLGIGLGLVVGFLTFYFLSYLGNGITNAEWNPISHGKAKLAA
jgi:hypothetical protein